MAQRTANRPALPDRVSLWMASNKRLILGALIAAAATAFAVWVTMPSLPFDAEREVVVHWLGGGAYLLAAVAVVSGVMLAVERARQTVRQDRRLIRQSVGLVVAAVAIWGIAGAFSPQASLGGTSLSEYGAGGRVGGWLDSPYGWVFIAIALAGSFALILPSAARSLVRASAHGVRDGFRALGREFRDRGPGALAAIGRGMWSGLVWLSLTLWRLVARSGRELRLAVVVIRDQWREARQTEPIPLNRRTPMSPPVPVRTPASTLDAEPAWPSMSETATPETGEVAAPARPTRRKSSSTKSTLRTLDRTAADGWRLPPIEILDEDPAVTLRTGAEDQARIIVATLASFGVDATITQINEGPAITQFGVEPGWEVKTRLTPAKDKSGAPVLDEHGQQVMRAEEVSRTRVRVNRITRLADDLALALAAPSIRIEAPVPGQPIVGVEVPNADTRIVALRGLIESDEFSAMAAKGGLPIALGRDVTGNPVIADLTAMPHVLIAGATGSGKSVCINTIISSLLMQKSPEEVRLILVDPKRVELTNYGSAPHLAFSHVVTEPDEVVSVLGVVVAEMDRRYRLLEQHQARNIVAYNSLPSTTKRMPYWVVVLDELADMMMAAAADVEGQIVRLAQLARAVGIHLVIATQRPSVDIVTGLIKANFPTRIAFATTSQTDARVILDRAGAEKLMGRGDMLYMSSDSIKPRRVQGAFVSDAEIGRLLESWSSPGQAAGERGSLDEMLEELSDASPSAAAEAEARAAQAELNTLTSTLESALESDGKEETPDVVVESEPWRTPTDRRGPEAGSGEPQSSDSRLAEATELAKEYERVSAQLLQRRMRIGRPRAERLIEQLAEAGVIEQSDSERSRRVLVRSDQNG
ncbi:MAG: DNA translocase FtsK [Chloroflexota bacterium]|nr:DNA translocase FtsK [Chloroflexota bacterium]